MTSTSFMLKRKFCSLLLTKVPDDCLLFNYLSLFLGGGGLKLSDFSYGHCHMFSILTTHCGWVVKNQYCQNHASGMSKEALSGNWWECP